MTVHERYADLLRKPKLTSKEKREFIAIETQISQAQDRRLAKQDPKYLEFDRTVSIYAFTPAQNSLKFAYADALRTADIPYRAWKTRPIGGKATLPDIVMVNNADAAEALAIFKKVSRRKAFRGVMKEGYNA